ncbi:MAG TPA: hypothetical protein VK943_08470 [Arenibaculum sp.]|nr:hypothetical protein [Arenibaculum sp.]
MFNTTPNYPTFSNVIEAMQLRLAQALADRRRRAGIRREEQRMEAELASMSARDRLEVDVTNGNRAMTRSVRRA